DHCSQLDDGRACLLEYNVVSWGRTKLPPQAGVAVYVRGESGKLAAARIYDDVDPPLYTVEPSDDQTSILRPTRSTTSVVKSVVPWWPPRSGVRTPAAVASRTLS